MEPPSGKDRLFGIVAGSRKAQGSPLERHGACPMRTLQCRMSGLPRDYAAAYSTRCITQKQTEPQEDEKGGIGPLHHAHTAEVYSQDPETGEWINQGTGERHPADHFDGTQHQIQDRG